MRRLALMLGMVFAATALHAQSAETCTVTAGPWDGKLEVSYNSGDCNENSHCHEGNSDMPWSRWHGIRPEDLQHERAVLDARVTAEAGEMRCSGTVRNGELQGAYVFTPNADFVRRMQAMGFGGLIADRLQGYAMLDITTEYVKEMQDAHVTGISTENLMGLRALGVDRAYVHAMAACGYPELSSQKLTGMKAVGVTPEKVKAVRDMGYSPSEDELIQMAVFKIDAPFVERMKARGFKNPTIAQLVQIRVFKLDE